MHTCRLLLILYQNYASFLLLNLTCSYHLPLTLNTIHLLWRGCVLGSNQFTIVEKKINRIYRRRLLDWCSYIGKIIFSSLL